MVIGIREAGQSCSSGSLVLSKSFLELSLEESISFGKEQHIMKSQTVKPTTQTIMELNDNSDASDTKVGLH